MIYLLIFISACFIGICVWFYVFCFRIKQLLSHELLELIEFKIRTLDENLYLLDKIKIMGLNLENEKLKVAARDKTIDSLKNELINGE